MVSIRNADFWLWELTKAEAAAALGCRFLSAMRIFGFGNARVQRQLAIQLDSFYPQCGFLALGTRFPRPKRQHRIIVSIRNADFWLWERGVRTRNSSIANSFYPQCGFLALGTQDDRRCPPLPAMFLSAMRIFGFGNLYGPPFV